MPSSANQRQLRLVLAGRFINDFGRGFSTPFAGVYFNEIVGFRMDVVGLAMAFQAVGGIPAVFVGGHLSDRLGRRVCLMASMLVSGLVTALLPWIHDPILLCAAFLVLGSFLALYWPISGAILVDLTEPEARGRVFSLLRVVVNAAIGLGMLTAGAFLWVAKSWLGDPARAYHVLFWIDGVTYLLFFVVLWVWVKESRPSDVGREPTSLGSGWGEAWRDGRTVALTLLLPAFTLMYANFWLFPVFFRRSVAMDEREISWVLALNTALVAFLQVPLWRRVDGWRRSRVLALSALCFGAGLVGFAVSADRVSGGLGAALAAMAVYTCGEILHGPAADALYGALAPSHLRGTYMSLQSLAFCVSMCLGPLAGGWLLERDRAGVFWGAEVALLAVSSAGLFVLERFLPQSANERGVV